MNLIIGMMSLVVVLIALGFYVNMRYVNPNILVRQNKKHDIIKKEVKFQERNERMKKRAEAVAQRINKAAKKAIATRDRAEALEIKIEELEDSNDDLFAALGL